MTVWVGTSGWSYPHWHGVLYPPGLPPGQRLAHYVGAGFDAVELNASFYRWPRPEAFARWRERLPEGFRLTVKAPRGLTHARRLADPGPWIERIAAGWAALGARAGVLLVQLPPGMERDDARLEEFLRRMPPTIPVAVELRHPTWLHDDVFALLERHGAAYVVMSGAHLPCVLRATAPFAYVRLHGPDHEHLYAGSYSDADLHWWAQRIGEWSAQGRDVHAYFNNDGHGHAVRNAWTLRAMLGDQVRQVG
jgi:uncharacterized protein YecE (DUF72 family)